MTVIPRLAAAIAAATFASPSLADTLSPAYGATSCYPYTDSKGQIWFSNNKLIAGTFADSCSYAVDGGGASGNGVATANFESGHVTVIGSGTITTSAMVTFEVMATSQAQPPVLPNAIPVNLEVIYALSATGHASASAILYSLNPTVPATPFDPPGVSRTQRFQRYAGGVYDPAIVSIQPAPVPFLLLPNEPRIVQKVVVCSAVSGAAVGGVASSCTADFDPVARFDQAAFDSMMGDQTFDLDTYYDLEYSPNFLQPVQAIPEPGSLQLLCGGLALLGVAMKRRRRAVGGTPVSVNTRSEGTPVQGGPIA